MPPKGNIPCTCRQCGTPFSTLPSVLLQGRGKFCGEPCYRLSRRVPVTDRFWMHVQKTADCWPWIGAADDNGYGLLAKTAATGNWLAHRVSWFIHYGVWPTLDVCHHCDNPPCIRPDHLFEGTAADNVADMLRKGRATKHNAKLAPEQVVEIKLNPDTSYGSNARIGRQYGVHRNTIRTIRTGEHWSTT